MPDTPTLQELEQKRTDWLEQAKERGMFDKIRYACIVMGEPINDRYGTRFQYNTRIGGNQWLIVIYRNWKPMYDPQKQTPKVCETFIVRIGHRGPDDSEDYRNTCFVMFRKGDLALHKHDNNPRDFFYVPGEWEQHVERAHDLAQAKLKIEREKPDEYRYQWLIKHLQIKE